MLYPFDDTGTIDILDDTGVIAETLRNTGFVTVLLFSITMLWGYAVTLLLLRSNKNVEMKKSNKIGGLMLVALGGCCFDTLYFFVTSGLFRLLHAMYIWEFRL